MRGHTGISFWLSVTIVLMTTAAAHAQRSATLGWVRAEGAESCANQAQIADAIAARLGYSPWQPTSAARLSIEAFIARQAQGFVVRVRTEDLSTHELGRRELSFEQQDCRNIDAPVSLALSLMIDPDVLDRPAPTQPIAVAPTPSCPEPVIATQEQAPQVLPARVPPAWTVGAAATVAIGPVKHALIGASWHFDYRVHPLVSIDVPVGLQHATAFQIDDTHGASLMSVWLSPQACVGEVGPDAFRARFCAGPWASLLITRAVGYLQNAAVAAPVLGGELGAHARIPCGDFVSLDLGVRAWFAAYTAKFVDKSETSVISGVFTWPTATALFELGVSFHDHS